MNSLSLPTWSLLILLLVATAGCVSAGSPRINVLLDRDYHRMSDAELIAYEQELNDELLKSSRSSPGDVSIGIGFGSWSGSGGSSYGVRSARRLSSGASDTSVALSERRDAVRAEMQERGLVAPKL